MTARIAVKLLCAAVMLVAASCSQIAGESDVARLENSEATWEKLKAQHDGNYSYRVRHESFTGRANETTATFRHNEIVELRYQEFLPWTPERTRPKGASWVKQGSELAASPEAARFRTIDDLYKEAREILGRRRESYEKLYLSFDDSGLLLKCFIRDSRIQDDAPRIGVDIAAIRFTEANP